MEYIVNTPCGAVRGTAGRLPGTVAYKGIRYATAGRWEYPVQVTGWEGVYDATAYGACSYQPRSFYNEEENLKRSSTTMNSARARPILTVRTVFS